MCGIRLCVLRKQIELSAFSRRHAFKMYPCVCFSLIYRRCPFFFFLHFMRRAANVCKHDQRVTVQISASPLLSMQEISSGSLDELDFVGY